MFTITTLLSFSSLSRQTSTLFENVSMHSIAAERLRQYLLKTVSRSPVGLAFLISSCRSLKSTRSRMHSPNF
uniref:Putative secreted protein n=1 Tax=Anopheles darlingi TaxID=43151 RepID=A0A2M4D2G6_ANODA